MMRLDVLQAQWLWLALLGGSALVLAIVLAYLAIWRTGRNGDGRAVTPSGSGKTPWVLILVYVATLVFALGYVIMRAVVPPNW